ncbi:MAG: N-formylglutamate amidohydrolase [Opitutales bacterium]|nr:N-formylglutamate amidohydrolase [Opitutales bacterium]
MPEGYAYLVTCEHASRWIPHAYRRFPGARICRRPENWQWDPGADALARLVAQTLRSEYFPGNLNRRLLDLDRSLTHETLFSKESENLEERRKATLLLQYYYPFRHQVRSQIEQHLTDQKKVVHLSIHTFHPRLKGQVKKTDIGIHFDPFRRMEKKTTELWLEKLKKYHPHLHFRGNSPYLGTKDGHVPLLRRIYGPENYLGFEILINQRLLPEREPKSLSVENVLPSFALLLRKTLITLVNQKAKPV